MNSVHWCFQHEKALDDLAAHLRLLGRSPKTIQAYGGGVKDFLMHTKKDVEDICADDAYRYLVELNDGKKLAGATINQRRAALHVFYDNVLEKPLPEKVLKYSKRPRRIPQALSPEEVVALLKATGNPKHRTAFMAMYSAGLRIEETTHLKSSDIDSTNMRIHIRAGKGNKDRQVMLSERLLINLREYWKQYRPKEWLFPSSNPQKPISASLLQRAFKKALLRARIQKPATPHSLRHSFAIHLLEAGTSLRYIQELLGHNCLQSTMVYLKAVPESASAVKSPLDLLQV